MFCSPALSRQTYCLGWALQPCNVLFISNTGADWTYNYPILSSPVQLRSHFSYQWSGGCMGGTRNFYCDTWEAVTDMLWDRRGCDRYVIWDIGDNILRQAIVGAAGQFLLWLQILYWLYWHQTAPARLLYTYTDRNLVKVFPRILKVLISLVFTNSHSSQSSHCPPN